MDISKWKVNNQKLSLSVSTAITLLPNDLIFIVSSYALSLADYLSAELRKRRTMIAQSDEKKSKWRDKYKDELSQEIYLQSCTNLQNSTILYDLADFSIIQTKYLYQVLRLRNRDLLPEIKASSPWVGKCVKSSQACEEEIIYSRKQSVNVSTEIQKLEGELWLMGLAACKHYIEASKQFKHLKNRKKMNGSSIYSTRESIKSIRYMDKCHDLLDELQRKILLDKRRKGKKEIKSQKIK